MPIQLSDHFSYRRLIRFTWPSMMMMIISSVYGVVDGVMVSNFVGTTPFAALNLIWPFIAILASLGFMIGTGGSALVAKTLGKGEPEQARSIFSMLTYATLGLSGILGILGLLLLKDVARLLGAEGEMLDYCLEYGTILLFALPACMMQIYFQSLLVTAEKPKMGMWVTVGAGVMNMALDVLFIGVWDWGLSGAAWATAISQVVGGGVPLMVFLTPPHPSPQGEGALRLVPLSKLRKIPTSKCNENTPSPCGEGWGWVLFRACFNGLSEFVMQISLSLVSMLYMFQLLREAGENGVAAYGIMMYFAFTFSAVFLGFGIGSAPVVSYHYGAADNDELKSLLRKSLRIIVVAGLLIVLAAQTLARPLCAFFVGYDPELLALTVHAFRIYSLMFLVTGFNIFASAFFTALNNGPVSAFISLMRTLVLEAASVLLLPLLFGLEGIWWSVTLAEGLTMLLSFHLIYKYRARYGY